MIPKMNPVPMPSQEIFRINSEYKTLTIEKKLEMLKLLYQWVDQELKQLEEQK